LAKQENIFIPTTKTGNYGELLKAVVGDTKNIC
jgi:hypothetical protein